MLPKLPPASYLLALICFLLPFVEVSCNGQKMVSLTGVQLLAGTQIGATPGALAPPSQIKPETAVVLAFIAGVAGLALSLLNQRRTRVIAGISGIVAAASLLALQQSIASGAPPQAMGLLQIQYQPGYFLSIGLFFVGAALLLYFAFARQAEFATHLPAPSPPYPAASPPASPAVSQSSLGHAPTQALPVFGQAGGVPQSLPSPTLRFCSHCGHQLAGDARFCAKCGSAQA